MITYADAKLIAENTDGKLTADDVMNLVEYGTMNSQDMIVFTAWTEYKS